MANRAATIEKQKLKLKSRGVIKLRCGTDRFYKDREFRRNEFGKALTEAYKRIIEEMSPDYVPPKKPTIRDGFLKNMFKK